ncbi:hypothetical protein E3T46_07655 [Cryobacterium sp. Hh11]|uniref:hypothetical protein n=1 Tax=Cryobacterium sp. Hh11 TaxID=2555868 RepID=UPI00106B76AB|nr:hypothetical protein [Cryobacterium sp. Hh11]TFD51955.1 hypothetical protein E3T46_07655 [Cryobacterium sp. Hh11]
MGIKESKGQTLSGVAIVLVVAAIVFIAIGVPTENFEMAIFGAIILGLAVLVGIVGMGMHTFRR